VSTVREDDRHTWPDAPVPVDGCVECERLVYAKTVARRDKDPSAQSDALVLLSQHVARAHP